MHNLRTAITLCRAVLFASALLAPMLPATAASLNARLNDARDLLASGAAVEAIDAYREVLIDAPDSGPALLGVACGLYRQAEATAENGEREDAAAKYEEAREAFGAIGYTHAEPIREAASFNAANAAAAAAKLKLATAEEDPNTQPEAVEALEKAIGAYDTVLQEFPAHPKAQQNLDHVRYLLMKLLQREEDTQPQMYTFSIIQNAETDLPGRVVNVLPPDAPPPAEDGSPQPAPPAGNTAVLGPASEATP